MKSVVLVFEEFIYNGIGEETLVYPCANEDIARKLIKERYEWIVKNSYFNNFIDKNGEVDRNKLDWHDCWHVGKNNVELFIDSNNTELNLYFVKEKIIKK